MLRKLINKIGHFSVNYFESTGQLVIMSAKTFLAIRKAHNYIDQIIEQFVFIGRYSLPIISIASLFMGLVLGVQIGTQISPQTPAWVEGGLILRSILLEMGPVITALILAGRVSSGIASEMGAMKVTEQIDALRTMAIDPIEYLVMPRLIAGMIAVPVLLVFADTIAIFAGFISSTFTINLNWAGFVKGMRHVFKQFDVYTSLIKAFIFGIVVVLSGCFFGMKSGHGAKGVGKATTHAVVWAMIEILILDYIISATLYFIW